MPHLKENGFSFLAVCEYGFPSESAYQPWFAVRCIRFQANAQFDHNGGVGRALEYTNRMSAIFGHRAGSLIRQLRRVVGSSISSYNSIADFFVLPNQIAPMLSRSVRVRSKKYPFWFGVEMMPDQNGTNSQRDRRERRQGDEKID